MSLATGILYGYQNDNYILTKSLKLKTYFRPFEKLPSFVFVNATRVLFNVTSQTYNIQRIVKFNIFWSGVYNGMQCSDLFLEVLRAIRSRSKHCNPF